MTLDDLPEVMRLERESFASPWSGELFEDELARDFSHILLARDGSGGLLGYICFWALMGEMHILNLAVDEKHRRKGIGTKLAVEAIKAAKRLGAGAATLEVREKNKAAIALYGKLGFVRAGLRKGYYEAPRDNAVIMWLYDMDKIAEKSP
jgi:ribosomal-protein-alanine N-acetyltransferase